MPHTPKIMMSPQRMIPILLFTVPIAVIASGCTTLLTDRYEASVTTTYVWQVEYIKDNDDRPGDRRLEEFASTALVTVNGVQPADAVTGPDDQGLWWPALPPRPTVDELESGKKQYEAIGTPELLKTADYALSFSAEGKQKTLTTDHAVYRQAIKASQDNRSLELTLDPTGNSVQKAEIR